MPRMSKTEVRRRLGEAEAKCGRVWLMGSDHLTPAQTAKVLKICTDLQALMKALK
jgi:hypothetical protein